MAKVADFLCRKCALLGSEFELGVAEPLKDLPEAGKGSSHVAAKTMMSSR